MLKNKLLRYLFFTQNYSKFLKKYAPELYLQKYNKEQGNIAIDELIYKALTNKDGSDKERHIKLIKALEIKDYKTMCKLIASTYRTYIDYSKFCISKIKSELYDDYKYSLLDYEIYSTERMNTVKKFIENTPIKFTQVRTQNKRFNKYQVCFDF